MKKNNDDFIMLPTVDFCFKELMNNPKTRKGFIAALLGMYPEEIDETTLLPAELPVNAEDEKLGVLDVRVKMADGTQMDLEMQVKYFPYWDERILFYLSRMFCSQIKRGESYDVLRKCIHVSILDFIHFPEDTECYRKIHFRDDATGMVYTDKLEIQILELKKLPKDMQSGDDIITWMKFFCGKNREEFRKMAETNEYLAEAYQDLLEFSADEKKRLEYEARQKAILDHNTLVKYMKEQGLEEGRKEGIKEGIKEGEERYSRLVLRLAEAGETELLVKAASDKELLKTLLERYGIS